jgi:hypothetical protein
MQPDEETLPGLPGWPHDRETPPLATPASRESTVLPAVRLETRVGPPPWAGLPSLSDPRGTLPTPGAIAEPPARARVTQEPQTLTTQIRTVQPPDVARQVSSELGVLAGELEALLALLADAGLAGSLGPTYRAVVLDYLDLCHLAWQAVAQEQLEQAGATPTYRGAAVEVARAITRLKRECEAVSIDPEARRPRGLPLLWRRRVGLIQRGLREWQAVLAPVPDPLRMGRALFTLQGRAGLACAGALHLALLDGLTSAALALLGLATLGCALSLVWALLTGTGSAVPTLATTSAVGVALWVLIVALGVRGALPVGALLGASVYVPVRAASLGWQGSETAAVLLRIWWLLITCLAAVAVPASLALSVAALYAQQPLASPGDALAALGLVGGVLYAALVIPVLVSVSALWVLALPFMLTAQARFVRESASNVGWVPAARRYALPASLTVVLFVTSLLVLGVALGATSLGWQSVTLLSVAWGPLAAALTVRTLALVVAAALPYLLLLDVPYRLGIRRWRAYRLSELARRRAELESQVRRLASQAANDELLRAMQYDLVLLQFYRGQEDEARTTRAAPFRLEGRLIALVLAVAGGLLVDGMGGVVIRTLVGPR